MDTEEVPLDTAYLAFPEELGQVPLSEKVDEEPQVALISPRIKVEDGTMRLFEVHPEHRLMFSKDAGTRLWCDVCGGKLSEKGPKVGVWSCRDCNYDLCQLCGEDQTILTPNGKFDIFLCVVGGCWNTDILFTDQEYMSITSNGGSEVKTWNYESKEWNESTEVIVSNAIHGALTHPIKFSISNVTLETLKDLSITLSLTDGPSTKLSKVFHIEFDKQLEQMYKQLGEDDYKNIQRFWQYVPFKTNNKAYMQSDDKRESYFSCQVPKLYLNDNALGFLNIEFQILGYSQKISPVLSRTSQIPSIDDIEVVKMIMRNRGDWDDFGKYLTTKVFTKAFTIYISRNWRNIFIACVDVLQTVKDNVRDEKPGNWAQVETECEKIVTTLLNYVPSDESNTTGSGVVNEVQIELEKITKENTLLTNIVENELSVFSGNDSFFKVINNLWEKRSAGLWPIKVLTSPSTLRKFALFGYLIFLAILSYHVFAIDNTDKILLSNNIASILNFAQFHQLSDFTSYEKWLNSTFIPALYENSQDYLYFLTDDILIRQIRAESKVCANPLDIPSVRNISTCYPRLKQPYSWIPPPWDNATITSSGKSILKSSIVMGYYNSEGYAVILSHNKSKAYATLHQLNLGSWLDWETQAVIIEFAIYSPNVELFATCAIIAEFPNVGGFQGSQECAMISPIELQHSFSWSAIVLYIFFAGFILQEIWEYILFALKVRPRPKTDIKKAEELCKCCPSFIIYINDIWNMLDLIMIFSGISSLALHTSAANALHSFTLRELWHVVELQQIANLFGAMCTIIAYLRVLNYLIQWEYIGVLVITVFKMMEAVIRFIIIFIFISIGFSSAFHILYTTNIRYMTWEGAFLSTAISTFSGYNLPDSSNVLVFIGPTASYFFQVLYIIIGVVLLLNFLIAMMNSVYDNIRENATKEYRWLMICELTQLRMAPWPVPFNLLQGAFGVLFVISLLIAYCFDWKWAQEKLEDVDIKEEEKISDPVVKQQLYAEMVMGYFKEALTEEEYKLNSQFDDFM